MLALVSVVALTLGLFTTSSRAATVQFDAVLDGLQETPPVATTGNGLGTLFLNDVTGGYTISGTFQSLIGTANNAHIHGPAPPGTPAGVVVGLTFDFGATSGNYSGSGTFTGIQMADLLAGLYYVNIHSTFRPGGEIRGQLVRVPEPASAVLLGSGIAAVVVIVLRRRRAS
jgi:hypothetical protein